LAHAAQLAHYSGAAQIPTEETAAMKRVTCALSILILGAQAAMAADPPGLPPGGPPRGGPSIERLAQDLNLDETQKAQVKSILDAQRAKHEAAREQMRASGQRPDRETMRAQMEQGDQELVQQLSGVLTPEQLQKFKQRQAERRQHMHEGPPPAPPAQ
jgi:Spy/CpxP family protein refolding chaperone